MITLEHVEKHFGALHALKDISGQIVQGEVAVLCGPSGSGKSTLIRTINRLEEIDGGRIIVAGQDIHEKSLDLNAFRERVGFVFQQFNLFPHLSVLDNITLAPRKLRKVPKAEAEEKALLLLDRVGLREKASAFPTSLSGGQSQRVAIARSLAMSPEVMLFDEPTSALDPEMVSEVLAVMTELAQEGMTMVCVTHEMGFARSVADTVWFLEAGRVEAQLSSEEFFESGNNPRIRAFMAHVGRSQ
ncbi:ABC transporter ATP-binding protein [Novosphingobium endophyticum]|uniref:ABC transporter ATP-binding protein n=1 Tax=Novosphingobium endophyticum TaxID=1955250 RepID=A0A916TWA5_9SPHN|nr:amino acid ABC transporter ATP-binding protein [Novosphingobium endophyticum]GGC14720.1 ABC transporter ATP-binding protein [Novosphingobium endophyticum]